MASNHGSRRYSDVRNGRESRFDNQHERMSSRNEAFSFRENENGRNNGNGSSRGKQPLLQFTTDINPACFSGPIPFSLISNPPKISPSPFPTLDPFISNSGTSEFNLERTARRNSSSHDSSEEERRYRRYRDQRERDRERSRGRERERDRSRDRTLERSLERTERDRDKPKERDFRDEIPNSTIMVRSLSSSVTEADLRAEVTKFGLEPKDIRLIREKDTGASRGFAFVEFSFLSEAVRWKELTKSTIFIDSQHRSTLHYSIPKDALGAEKVLLNRADWDCSNCGMSNFRRRDYCFKCNSPREDFGDVRSAEGYNEISPSPSNTLLFRNLDVLTTEERVLAMLGQLTTLPIKSLRVAKDVLTNTSRGFAFVELHSTSEATQLHDLLLAMKNNFYVDGRQVTVSYAKRSLSSMNSAASANAAVVALAAAQWTNQEPDSYHTNSYYGTSSSTENLHSQDSVQALGVVLSEDDCSELGTVIVQGVTYKKFPMPDISTYQYDDSSGYYYDSSTRLYYDARSQYYYNSETQQYLYWDNEQQTYLPASSEATASLINDSVTISAPISLPDGVETENQEKGKTKKVEKLDKVKIAKKIAKDMERWAKTLNQKKENAKLGIIPNTFAEPIFAVPMASDMLKQSAAADAGFAILEQKASLSERSNQSNEAAVSKGNKKMPTLVAQYGDDSESESEEDSTHPDVKQNQRPSTVDESKLTDWSKLACLLCKRQFPTKDVLIKHQQISDLHKKNLAKLSTRKPH